jgi:hypothetical protein
LKDLIQKEIETPEGKGFVEQIYLTELGEIMMRIYIQKKKKWTNIRLINLNNLVDNTKYKLGTKFKVRRINI